MILFLYSFSTYGADAFLPIIKDVKLKNFKAALTKLNKINNKNLLGKKFYYQGLCQARLKQFDKAVKSYELAIKYRADNIDLYYELGQAYYAVNALNRSLIQFKKSVSKNYKTPTSLYYLGYINQILENHQDAVSSYNTLIENKNTNNVLKQIGYFQKANSRLSLSEERKDIKEVVKNEILPDYERALNLKKTGGMAKKIKARINEIKIKYDLDPYVLLNGKRVSERPWNLSFSHKLKYDSNITLQSELPTTRVAGIDSFIHDTQLSGDYRFIVERRLIVTPALTLEQKVHSNRSNSSVYSNDTYDVTFTLGNSWETKAFDKPSSYLFDFEYKYSAKDRLSRKERIYNSRYLQYSFGKNFSYFAFGPTTIKAKYKDLNSYTGSSDNITKTLSFTQLQILKIGHVLVYTVQADFTSVSLPSSSSSNFLLRADYIIPKLWPKYSLNPFFSVAFLDPRESRPSRGIEKTFTPGFKLTKSVTDKFKFVAGYSYSKKYSRNESSYAYSKNEFLVDLKYKF